MRFSKFHCVFCLSLTIFVSLLSAQETLRFASMTEQPLQMSPGTGAGGSAPAIARKYPAGTHYIGELRSDGPPLDLPLNEFTYKDKYRIELVSGTPQRFAYEVLENGQPAGQSGAESVSVRGFPRTGSMGGWNPDDLATRDYFRNKVYRMKLSGSAAVAKVYVVVEPMAAGAGLPELKADIGILRSADGIAIFSAASSARSPDGSVHLLYEEVTTAGQVVVRYARRRPGSGWEVATLDTLARARQSGSLWETSMRQHRPEMLAGSGGLLHAAWFSATTGTNRLVYAVVDTVRNTLRKTTVAETGEGRLAYQIGLALDSAGVAHLSWYDDGLRYATNAGGGFVPVMVMPDEKGTNALDKGVNSAVVVARDGTVYIPYTGIHARDGLLVAEYVDCAVGSGGTWKNTGIAGELGRSYGESLYATLDDAGQPTVVYTSGGGVGISVRRGTTWYNTFHYPGKGLLASGDSMTGNLGSAGTGGNRFVMAWPSRDGRLVVSRFDGSSWSGGGLENIHQPGMENHHARFIPAMVPGSGSQLELFVPSMVDGQVRMLRLAFR